MTKRAFCLLLLQILAVMLFFVVVMTALMRGIHDLQSRESSPPIIRFSDVRYA